MSSGFVKVLLFSALIVVFVAADTRAQNITAAINGGEVTRGAQARGTVTMSIPGGLHVNSNRPSSEYSIPTTVNITASGAKVGSVTYPRGANRKFEFSENAINVYQGTIRFPFSVKVPSNFKGDVIRLRAVVRYQACTNEVCYPPKTKDITFTARVR